MQYGEYVDRSLYGIESEENYYTANVREAITPADVAKDSTGMQAFLSRLSNRKLATLISGTSLNRTPFGDVGCNHPLYVRGVPAAQTADGPRGVFMTDWRNDSDHVAELKAGHDLKMATGDIDGVTAALDKGDLSREAVYPCAARVMRMLLRLKTVQDFLKK